MRKVRGFYLVIFLLVALSGCNLPTPEPTPTFLSPQPVIQGTVSGADGTGGTGGGGAGGGAGGAGEEKNPASTPVPTDQPTATPQPSPEASGPYIVQQIISLGHETISGQVCSLTEPFIVTSVAPAITFTFNYVPDAADRGKWTYAYNLSAAGESHDAKGTYTLSKATEDGTLLLKMTGSDHVVFTGFDGNIPVRYSFNLVPSGTITCPAGG